jgi:2-isopropylmalate synthase
LIPNLLLKYNDSLLPKIKLRKMTETSRFVSEIINTSHPSHLPYVGTSAFTHKGGIHVSAILKNATTYEHVDPSLVGNRQEVVVSELSGQSNIIYKAKELGVHLDKDQDDLRNVVKQVKALEHQGYHFEGADGSLRILIEKALNRFTELFQLESARIITEKRKDEDAYSEVSIKVNVKGQEVHTASGGNGPVNALDKAMRKALMDFYPRLKDFYLVDYKVRVLDSNDGTEAKVRVLIETSDGNNTWGTVGASTNIIEASWKALVDSIEYGLTFTNKEKEVQAS